MSIPTLYADIQFRSRLEARWAAFFDGLGWPWEYEPAELEGWIPDFRLNLYRPLWVEIKPEHNCKNLEPYEARLKSQEAKHEILLLGDNPILDTQGWSEYTPVLGSLLEVHSNEEFNDESGWVKLPGCQWGWFSRALWRWCAKCSCYGFMHDEGHYHSRVCGHTSLVDCDPQGIRDLWKRAGNDTQWNAPRIYTKSSDGPHFDGADAANYLTKVLAYREAIRRFEAVRDYGTALKLADELTKVTRDYRTGG